MIPLVQWLLVGLAIAIVCLPLVRWFWKRWDKPTPEMLVRDEEQREEVAEARVWAAMEAKIDAEVAKKNEWAEIQMEKAVALVKAKPLNEVSASKAWDALGVDEPIIISTAPEVDISDLLDQEETIIESKQPPVEIEEEVEVPSMLNLPDAPSEIQVPTEDEFSQVESSSEISASEESEQHVIEHFAAPVRQHDPDMEDDWHDVLW